MQENTARITQRTKRNETANFNPTASRRSVLLYNKLYALGLSEFLCAGL